MSQSEWNAEDLLDYVVRQNFIAENPAQGGRRTPKENAP